MRKTVLKAQALAIVMVVLVVASIIGVSLFSRMSKDRQSVINQQDSAMAEEQADAILDVFVGTDIVALEGVLNDDDNEELVFSRLDDIDFVDILTDLGVSDRLANDDRDWCQSSDGQNEEDGIRVTLEYTEDGEFLELQPGSVRAYNIGSATILSSPCVLRLGFRAVDDNAVFLIKFVEDDGSEEYESYCIGQDGSDCGEMVDVEYEENLSALEWNLEVSAFRRSVNLENMVTNNVGEIRIIPLSGTLAVSDFFGSAQMGCIDREFRSVKIKSEVNCNGSYRGKQMYLPGSGNLGYSALFDYVIYDNGLFQP